MILKKMGSAGHFSLGQGVMCPRRCKKAACRSRNVALAVSAQLLVFLCTHHGHTAALC